MNRLFAAMLALFVPLSFLCGCSNPSDGGDDGGDGDVAPLRTSPASALERLAWAYNHMDAEIYLDCLSEDFAFFLDPEEVEEHPELPAYLNKPDERTIHEAMFGSQDGRAVDSVELTLTQIGDPIPIEIDPGVFHYQYKESVDLRVRVGDIIYLATAPVLFEFREDEDQTGPGGETLWEVCAWYDIGRGKHRGSAVQLTSWGTIKVLFL
jgi:hypothetical protein